jgi:hypothetical protein
MSRLAAETLELAIAEFPRALLPPGGANALRGVVARLSPSQPLYFECRLAGAGDPVDVSVQFHAANGGARALQALAISRAQDLRGEAASTWRRIADFAADWAADEELGRRIAEIGLEYDAGRDGTWMEIPALFAGAASDLLLDCGAVARVVEAVLPDGREAWQRMLAALQAAERQGLRAGRMVGVMLSRDAQLRCMIRHLRPDRVRAFLAELRWRGDLEGLLAQPQLAGDAARLVLGFAPDLLPDCGIEMIYGRGEREVPGRVALMRWLVDARLADPARVAALDEWTGAITPLNAKADWPAALIARALTEPADTIDLFHRAFSHVKLNLSGGEIRTAKAYLALVPTRQRLGATAHA